MVYELEKEKFHLLAPLLGPETNMMAKAVVQRINPGWVFVDDLTTPQTALIWSKGIEGFFFLGEHRNKSFNKQISNFIEKMIRPRAYEQGLEWFEVSGDSRDWDETIETIFDNRKIAKSLQRVYRYNSDTPLPNPGNYLPVGYTLARIEPNLMEMKGLENKEFVFNKIHQFWDTEERFFQQGLGFYILFENQIVSVCLSAFVSDNVHSIEIETLDGHKRKRLAESLVNKYVNFCIEKGFSPYWDAMEENVPSCKLAEKIGFDIDFVYKLYGFSLV
ncbi:GNAT family N-acetyltransferase [Brevibacillus laterosporus]|uniref:N-acetyltransferase domain-containing protein n=1 Tax=Brevibacillus laterosporus TaxID=1465 RepID=A0A0F7C1R7_BRELA|nr:GNAT family N-acetyltransferase [Brevibacillus laterosporus]AKF95950.1 hypothetical protein EX87_20445 [Brevibacillus laterosporus]